MESNILSFSRCTFLTLSSYTANRLTTLEIMEELVNRIGLLLG